MPSYLSIDSDSRVVRLDSWSKVLAPGLRLGWVTAHPDVVDLMALALHASLNGPPGISQVPTGFLLCMRWPDANRGWLCTAQLVCLQTVVGKACCMSAAPSALPILAPSLVPSATWTTRLAPASSAQRAGALACSDIRLMSV